MPINHIMSHSQPIPSVNFHLWQPCNMRCKFCFAPFLDVKQQLLPKGHLPMMESVKVVRQLAKAGFQKINFAGGEPTLCPWLPELIEIAKAAGMTTSIVTNGSQLTEAYLNRLQPHLDWIAVSIDSVNPNTNLMSGRATAGKHAYDGAYYVSMLNRIRSRGFRLKVNTTVNRTNYRENLNDFIRQVDPERWKVFQVLPVEGQNSAHISDFAIANYQFDHFLRTHRNIECLVPESNELLTGSYVMLDPAGRFFDNVTGRHNYSDPILEVGWQRAIGQIDYRPDTFQARGGHYDWE